jgi:hypothetical protein
MPHHAWQAGKDPHAQSATHRDEKEREGKRRAKSIGRTLGEVGNEGEEGNREGSLEGDEWPREGRGKTNQRPVEELELTVDNVIAWRCHVTALSSRSGGGGGEGGTRERERERARERERERERERAHTHARERETERLQVSAGNLRADKNCR